LEGTTAGKWLHLLHRDIGIGPESGVQEPAAIAIRDEPVLSQKSARLAE
jgi:hypothetical protein